MKEEQPKYVNICLQRYRKSKYVGRKKCFALKAEEGKTIGLQIDELRDERYGILKDSYVIVDYKKIY